MGPFSNSGLATPFVCAEGGSPFKPIWRIIVSLAPLAHSPTQPHPPIKYLALIAFPGSREEKKKKRKGREEEKESIVGAFIHPSLHIVLKQQTVNPVFYEERGTTVKSTGGLAHRFPIQPKPGFFND